jgi:hemerythrin
LAGKPPPGRTHTAYSNKMEGNMTVIQWNDSLKVNVGEFDFQHQRLVQMINELDGAMHEGQARAALEKVIRGLVLYAATHFKTEEKYFSQYEYPDAKSHSDEHSDFIDKIYAFNIGFEKGNENLSDEIMAYLSDWLKNHIQVSDKRNSAYLNTRGMF